MQTVVESLLNNIASQWNERIQPEASVNTIDATIPAGVITLRVSHTPNVGSNPTPVQPSRFQPLLMQLLPVETTTDRMVLGELQAWVQSVPRRAWQRIHTEEGKLRVGVTFQDDVEIFSVCSYFPSKINEHLAETITLIGAYIQMESEVRDRTSGRQTAFLRIDLLLCAVEL